MEKEKYNKEDLLWEAVRRNEDYKKFYKDELKSHRPSGRKLSEYKRLSIFPLSRRWQMWNLPDPSLDIERIKTQIATYKNQGKDPSLLHPFLPIFREQKRPVVHHEVPGSPYNKMTKNFPSRYKLSELENNDKIVCIDKNNLINDPYDERINRILVSIDPMASDVAIIDEIKKIKSAARDILANLSKEKPREKTRLTGIISAGPDAISLHIDKIDSYIGWLKVYDQAIEECTKLKGRKSLSIEDGVLVVPSNFDLIKLVPNDISTGKFDSEFRRIKEAYRGAIKLIQVAPNIYFHSSKKRKTREESSTIIPPTNEPAK